MKKGVLVGMVVLVMVGFDAGVGFSWPVPDTGQTKCYDDEGNEINPCPGPGEPFYGQDGNYLINPPSYAKLDGNGNELSESSSEWAMVRDEVTGLIWEVKTDDGTVHDKDDSYTWYDFGNFINVLNSQTFGGYSDWRMPMAEELFSISTFLLIFPSINQKFFPNTDTLYWSSSSYVYDPDDAWRVTFLGSGVDYESKSNQNGVRAVRGRKYQLSEYLVVNGDSTVTDPRTGLMWQQSTSDEEKVWVDALSFCESLTLAGYTDWRLPTIKEMASIVDRSRFFPAFDDTVFWGYSGYMSWSSTSNALLKDEAFYVDFGGGLSFDRKTFDRYVRAVRGGQNRISGHLVISAPRQASKWNIDTEMPITWDPAGISDNVSIALSREGGRPGTYETIASSTPNDGSFQWTVSLPYTFNAMLKIEPVSDPTKGTVQGLFSIVNDVSIGPLHLKISEPTDEATFTIKLNKAPTAEVVIDLSTTNPGEFTLVAGSNNRTNDLTVTLDATNWEMGVDVTVRAEADNAPDGDQVSQVLTSIVRSVDPDFSGLNIANIMVTVEDDQTGVYADSVFPSYGTSTEDLSATVQGLGFVEGTTRVFIISPNGVETEVSPVTVDNAKTLHVTIPAPAAPVDYDLKAANSDTETDTLKSAISFADAAEISAQLAKKAVIVAGGGPFLDNDLWTATRRNANHAYSALAGQGYDADSIQYLTPGFEDIDGDGETDADADANLATLETAITDWAVNTEPAATDLLLYLIGPARAGQFLLKSTEGYEVALSASTLNGSLDAIQSSLTGNLIVIIDAPQAGSFLAPLADPNRIVIAGSSANGRAWFLDDGEISFSWPFWEAVYNDGELFAAFDRADDVIGHVQTPAIDANGDGLPDPRNRRAPDDPITLGRGRDVDTDPPSIGKICPDATLETGYAYELWAEEVTADNGLSQIWARIFPPVEAFQPGDRPVLVLPTLRLQDPDGDERYAETHEDFTQSGAYKVLIHATDKRDHQSIPKPVRVTQTQGLTFDIGDLNVNGVIDLSDVITALKAAAGLSIHDTLHLEPTGDERIGVPDALFLLQKIAGLRVD